MSTVTGYGCENGIITALNMYEYIGKYNETCFKTTNVTQWWNEYYELCDSLFANYFQYPYVMANYLFIPL